MTEPKYAYLHKLIQTHTLSLSDDTRDSAASHETHSIFSARAHIASHAPLSSRGGERERVLSSNHFVQYVEEMFFSFFCLFVF